MSEANDNVSPILEDCACEEYILARADGYRGERTMALFRCKASEPYSLEITPDLSNEIYGMALTRDELIDAAIVFLKAAQVREYMIDRRPSYPERKP